MEDIVQWKWTALELYLFADSSVAGHYLGAAYAKKKKKLAREWGLYQFMSAILHCVLQQINI